MNIKESPTEQTIVFYESGSKLLIEKKKENSENPLKLGIITTEMAHSDRAFGIYWENIQNIEPTEIGLTIISKSGKFEIDFEKTKGISVSPEVNQTIEQYYNTGFPEPQKTNEGTSK